MKLYYSNNSNTGVVCKSALVSDKFLACQERKERLFTLSKRNEVNSSFMVFFSSRKPFGKKFSHRPSHI